MKKSDLKTGMIVEYRDGRKRMIMSHNFVDENGNHCFKLDNYNEDLIHLGIAKGLDIMKVYDVYQYGFDFDCEYRNLVWERKEKPKLTPQERTLLEALEDKWKYIARDKEGDLYIYGTAPQKNSLFRWGYSVVNAGFTPFNHLFTFITWEDTEPYSIKELLDNE